MRCANPTCGAETLYLRTGGIFAVDFLGGADSGECQGIRRKVIWLCDACNCLFAVETWRPPGQQIREQARPPRSYPVTPHPLAPHRAASAEKWS